MTETQIQAALFAHFRVLRVPDAIMFAVPNAGAFGQPGLLRGVCDIIAINPAGVTGYLEIKTDKGRLSVYQEAFLVALEKVGARYAVTYGRDEPIRVLEDWGVIRRVLR